MCLFPFWFLMKKCRSVPLLGVPLTSLTGDSSDGAASKHHVLFEKLLWDLTHSLFVWMLIS